MCAHQYIILSAFPFQINLKQHVFISFLYFSGTVQEIENFGKINDFIISIYSMMVRFPSGQVSYFHHLASVVVVRRPSYVVRRKRFQKSSPLKILDQWKPNLV
jgi:hypothetical protein